MQKRADPAKLIIENRTLTGALASEWVQEGRLIISDRRAIGPKQKSDLWDCHFLSLVVVGVSPGTVVIDMRTEPYKVLDGNARIGAIVDFLNGDTLRHPNSDMDQLSLWELGGLGGRVIERRLSEAVFSVSYIMPGTGDKEFETIAQFLRPWQ